MSIWNSLKFNTFEGTVTEEQKGSQKHKHTEERLQNNSTGEQSTEEQYKEQL